MAGSAVRVFVSHGSHDTWIARQMARRIDDCGATTFIDVYDIKTGDEWLSPAALHSPSVMSEIGTALASRKPVIPVVPPNRRIPRDVSVPFEQVDVLRAGKLTDAEIASSLMDSLRRATEG
ncbi:MAG TPA: toll/interleukin-1 receptor domain-containing protein [Acetobacteraceae bacterium]|jgi:hypothetical protein